MSSSELPSTAWPPCLEFALSEGVLPTAEGVSIVYEVNAHPCSSVRIARVNSSSPDSSSDVDADVGEGEVVAAGAEREEDFDA